MFICFVLLSCMEWNWEVMFLATKIFCTAARCRNNEVHHLPPNPDWGGTRGHRVNNNNNDRLTAFDPGQPG